MNEQYAIAIEHAPSYAPEDFVRNAALDAALAQLADSAQWAEPVMLLVGPNGCGKTHFLHMLAAQTACIFFDCEALKNQPIETWFAVGNIHIIEDVGASAHPELVAQAINHARAQGLPLLLSISAPPSRMVGLLPDMQSRLNAAQQTLYPEADDALLMAVMAKRFSDLQWRVAPDILQYLLTRLPRNVSALHRFIAHADKRAMEAGRALTMPFARELLAGFEPEEAHA